MILRLLYKLPLAVTNSIPRPTVIVNSALTNILYRPITYYTKTRGKLLLLLLEA